ncbi:MAG: multiheme c-type cytochrome [Bacteroidota bacterium]
MFIRPYRSIDFKSFLIGTGLFMVAFVIYKCKNPEVASDYHSIEPVAIHKNGKAFAGSASCIPCHAHIYDTQINTAHFKTSALADSSKIKGSFELGKNTFTLNDRVQFTMMATDSGYYQRANFIHNQLELFNLKVDVVFGSGTKGQSYLSWDKDALLQLQTSYLTKADRWTSSPGVKELSSPKRATGRCIECHSTYAKNTTSNIAGNGFDKDQIIYGIDCERCHGPSAKHVGYHQKNPTAKVSKYMVKHKALSRQQRLDACALCHSGGRKQIRPPFSFLVGDDLDKFSIPGTKEDNTSLDVHGNQYELLTRSLCFEKSEKMDCSTCHDPHKNERGNTRVFNRRCIGCHTLPEVSCTIDGQTMNTQKDNCISCHMPLIPSSSMVMQLDSVQTAVEVRTHLIDIYPQ